ncbi:hypothetical protein SG34_026330 [Thalassomonas viridans]|uniref:Uncharacterized protein n=1 Tax=Thalassomonas viridans TaxID=137584 RepID=A0AAE9Z2E8_9GAMM|nr:hypothetical protein [Thalassomonas viridans]WDE04789.1 hypothetical protein SG34_026330 [Thalassomonas viridans]
MSKFHLCEDEAKISEFSSDLITLCDEFGEFSDECAFICDAFAAVASEPECINEDISEGFRHVSYRLKCQVKDYYQRINQLHMAFHGHLQQADTNPDDDD